MVTIINSVNLRQLNNENVKAFAAQANSLKLEKINVKNTKDDEKNVVNKIVNYIYFYFYYKNQSKDIQYI